MAIKWTPDKILVRAVGAVGLAGVVSVLNNVTGQVTSALKNGDMFDWLVIAADLFNVAPDGTTVGDALDAATDGAMFDLAHSLFSSRLQLSSINPFGQFVGAPAVGQPVTPAAAAATGQPSPSSTSPAMSTSAPAAPVPAASMSAAGDVATAGY
jgi:hypothetical protein